MSVHVVRAGPLTTVQDLGRPGYAHLGVPPSGALDLPSLRRANRLVGNPDVLRSAGSHARRTRDRDRSACVRRRYWRRGPGSGRDIRRGDARRARDRVRLGTARRGCAPTWPSTAASTSRRCSAAGRTDILSGLGPPVVADGVVLPLGSQRSPPGAAPYRPHALAGRGDGLHPGPRSDWLTDRNACTRPRGPSPRRATGSACGWKGQRWPRREGELPSEGIVTGAVQLPRSGEPLIFLADHPTTGGYPVIGVVDEAALPLLGAGPSRIVAALHAQRMAAYPGLITPLMRRSRSSNGRNADFIALTVSHCRSSQP